MRSLLLSSLSEQLLQTVSFIATSASSILCSTLLPPSFPLSTSPTLPPPLPLSPLPPPSLPLHSPPIAPPSPPLLYLLHLHLLVLLPPLPLNHPSLPSRTLLHFSSGNSRTEGSDSRCGDQVHAEPKRSQGTSWTLSLT